MYQQRMEIMIPILAAIHEKLDEIRTAFEKRQRDLKTNRDAAIAYVHFFSETVKSLAPGFVDLNWYGSYSNPDVANYPVVQLHIHTTVTGRHQTLFSVYIDTGGKNPPDVWTQEQILEKVDTELARVKREAALFELL